MDNSGEDLLDYLGRAIHPFTGDPELCRKLGLPHYGASVTGDAPTVATTRQYRTDGHVNDVDWYSRASYCDDCDDNSYPVDDTSYHRRTPPPRQKSQLRVRWPPHRFAPLSVDDTTALLAAAEAMSRYLKASYWANPQWCLRESARDLWGPENWRTQHVHSVVPSPSRRTVRSLEKRRRARQSQPEELNRVARPGRVRAQELQDVGISLSK